MHLALYLALEWENITRVNGINSLNSMDSSGDMLSEHFLPRPHTSPPPLRIIYITQLFHFSFPFFVGILTRNIARHANCAKNSME